MKFELKNIATGWGKSFGLLPVTEAEAAMAALRNRICELCPDSKANAVLRILNGKGQRVNVLFCTICKCPCKEKALVTAEKCPINKW